MISTALRPQRNVVGMTGRMCRAWEFDYDSATFYIQETGVGYAVVEEMWSRGAWMPVQRERQQMVIAEFERVRGKRRE